MKIPEQISFSSYYCIDCGAGPYPARGHLYESSTFTLFTIICSPCWEAVKGDDRYDPRFFHAILAS